MVKIKFCGAAKTVTGSNYLVETDHGNFVVDCGMFQGPEVERWNLRELPYDASKVNFTLSTHAHIDHSGMLPKLTVNGFDGPIYATNHSVMLATELLLDSAKIQESNYTRGDSYGKFTRQIAYVYNTRDAEKTIAMFKSVNFSEQFEPIPGIKITYHRAGHVLGAASIEVEIKDGDKVKKLVFSGDIGREEEALIQSYDQSYRSEADYLLIEALYGGEIHPSKEDSLAEMFELINKTLARGGNVYIPSFALQRTQLLLNEIKNAKKSGKLAKDVPVYLDSPLAQRVTNIYMTSLQNNADNLFDFEKLFYVKKYKQSLKISNQRRQIIIAGSGMADGGRIMQHLSTGLAFKKNTVIFVGYQAEGTLGRELVEGAQKVLIGDKKVDVNAQIEYLHGFSAHGDSSDYLKWLKSYMGPKMKRVFLIHAEPDRSVALKEQIEDEFGFKDSYVPEMNEEIVLD